MRSLSRKSFVQCAYEQDDPHHHASLAHNVASPAQVMSDTESDCSHFSALSDPDGRYPHEVSEPCYTGDKVIHLSVGEPHLATLTVIAYRGRPLACLWW